MSNIEIIEKLLSLGKIPNNEDMSDELFQKYDDYIQSVNQAITLEEAKKLILLFSDDCDDLNWGLLHLIESVDCSDEDYIKLIMLCHNEEYRKIFETRLKSS